MDSTNYQKRVNFPSILIEESIIMAFLTGQSWRELKSLYTGEGPEQRFQRCFNIVYKLEELRFLADKLLIILFVVYVSIKQLRLSRLKNFSLLIRLTSFYSTYDITLIK